MKKTPVSWASRLCCLAGLAMLLAAPSTAFGWAGKVLAQLQCPVQEPIGMTSDGQALWITDMATRTVVKVRPADGTVADKLDLAGNMPSGVAWHDGVLYLADRAKDRIARRKLVGGPDLSHLPYYEKLPAGMAHDGAHLWVVDQQANKIHELDAVDGTTVQSFDAPAKAPTGLAFDGRYLWVADHGTDEIYRVNPKDGKVVMVIPAPGPYPTGLAVLDGSLWVADYQEQQLYKLAMPDGTPYIEDQERRAHVGFEVTYQAQGKGRIIDLVAMLALPRELPGQHLLSTLQLVPEPTRIETDRWGQQVAVYELGTLEPGEVRRVGWEGDFALFRTRFQLVPEMISEPSSLDPSLAPYLKDERKYDLNDPVIGELVAKLTAGKSGPYERARALYDYLTSNIVYDRSGGWNDAAAVLKRGTGSCSEYTFALVALLRKAGIPARYVGAVSERGDEASFDDIFHRWAEAFLPGYGWVPIDANAGYGTAPGERGSFFGGRSNRHVVTTIAGGESELLDWSYNNHERWGVEGAATLDVEPLARYRPIASHGEIEPHRANMVLAPTLTRPFGVRGGFGGTWLAISAVLLSLGLGIGVGMIAGLRRRED